MNPPELLEAVAAVKRDIPGVGGLQVRRQSLPIEPLKRVPHQRITMSSALMRRVHADERQVPMRLLWVEFRYLLEYRTARLLGSWRGGRLHVKGQ